MDAFAPEPTAFAARRESTIHQSRPIPESPSSPRVDRKEYPGSLSIHPRFMTHHHRRRRHARTKGANAPRRHFPHAKETSHPHPSCRPPCASSRRPAPVANTRFATWRKLISGACDAPTRSTRFVRFARDGGDDDADDPDARVRGGDRDGEERCARERSREGGTSVWIEDVL